ncbi:MULTISPECIES: L-fucose:H+ symporter permease [Ignavibacterium]|jgi:FHS family L-fucose permease-like MFS transporter|uniref:L-fucose:H+ symporter permease n=1 Tax=Ignavibacterium TaxID=795750 RepID=UPI0025BA79B3|nr:MULTISPECIES: L-fucose:H+ symporter permease [Ignavibacterium]MBI5662611.1 L-fucose:H+ symporter permease [Ignavibacterium album]
MASTSTSSAKNLSSGSDSQRNYLPELTILTSLFFMWGFLTCLNDILIPHLQNVFELNYFESMLVQFTFFLAYFLISLPSGKLVEKVGYKKGIVIGLITAGIGTLIFYPAAGLRSYPVFLIAFFILASGITLLQVAANPYVTILGKPETASSRLNLTQAFNSLGTTVAPYFGSLLILSTAVKTADELSKMTPNEVEAYKVAEAAAVQYPYLGLAAVLFIIAAIFAIIKLPQIEASTVQSGDGNGNYDEIHESAWGYKHLLLGAVGIFVYVGAEVAIGSFLVKYFVSLDNSMLEMEAGKMVSFYWGGAMVGRFIGSAVQRKIKPGTVLGFNAIMASLLVLTSMMTNGNVAMWSILLVGLFNSIMFPTIFSLAIRGLGKHTGQASGILCMAIVGGAVIPVIQGLIADSIGIHHAFILPVLCYLFIAYYGFKGSIPSFEKAELAVEVE